MTLEQRNRRAEELKRNRRAEELMAIGPVRLVRRLIAFEDREQMLAEVVSNWRSTVLTDASAMAQVAAILATVLPVEQA